jgi:hypothetical protein
MAQPKKLVNEGPFTQAEIDAARHPFAMDELKSMLKWVGERIVIRNANGKRSDKLCLMCKEARRLRLPCQHARIWELTR